MKSADEKLTLKLKRTAILRAKAFAKENGTSVSRMVEEYFEFLNPGRMEIQDSVVPEVVKELLGSVARLQKYEDRRLYHEYLAQKYR